MARHPHLNRAANSMTFGDDQNIPFPKRAKAMAIKHAFATHHRHEMQPAEAILEHWIGTFLQLVLSSTPSV